MHIANMIIIGGGLGLGFYENSTDLPGGVVYFLSTGNKGLCKTEEGRKLAASMPELVEGRLAGDIGAEFKMM